MTNEISDITHLLSMSLFDTTLLNLSVLCWVAWWLGDLENARGEGKEYVNHTLQAFVYESGIARGSSMKYIKGSAFSQCESLEQR